MDVGTTVRRAGRFAGLSIVALVRGGWNILLGILAFCENWLTSAKHAQYGTAVMRIALGVAAMGMLVSNFAARSYVFGPASFWNGEHDDPKSDFPGIWLFSLGRTLAGDLTLFTIFYLVLAALAILLMLGWRTRIVLPVFFVLWVSFVELNDASGDQGDNAYRICLFWLMFAESSRRLSLDARRWDAPVTATSFVGRLWQGDRFLPAWFTNTAHNLVLVILTAQVCFIYASGALYKAGGEPWAEGIAVYAPLHVAKFGTWPVLSDLITAWGPMVVLASWGSIILQMSFPFMLMNRFTRIIALLGILSFHIAIGVFMGLPWFSLSMIAIDAIFIRDETYLAVGRRARGLWERARQRTDDEGEPVPASASDEAPLEAAEPVRP